MARKAKDLVFLSLGGIGEIGINMYVYGYGPEDNRQWIIVDMGIGFSSGYPPAVDVFLPDVSFMEKHKDNIQAIIITHGHEDHIGAIPWLWERLEAPIYASPFASTLIKNKLAEVQLQDKVPMHELQADKPACVGAFEITPLLASHSTLEPYHLLIETPAGKIFHSGDWKFDDKPVTHTPITKERLKSIGDEGVLALVCDSTNILEPDESGSEADLFDSFYHLFKHHKGRIFVTCFSSNVARMQTIAEVAKKLKRSVVAEGGSIKKMEKAARENGYLAHISSFLTSRDKEFEQLRDHQQLILCTGSQGEPRAALSRLAFGTAGKLQPSSGDMVVFSSKAIPGNEVGVYRLQNALIRLGTQVVTSDDAFVHVSGHPSHKEVVELYGLLRPKFSLPMHGEYRMLQAHAQTALDQAGCQQALIAENGSMVRIAKGGMEIIDEIYTNRLVLEEERVLPIDSDLVRNRTKALYAGFIVVTVIMDVDGNLFEMPKISAVGIIEDEEIADLRGDISVIIDKEFDRVSDEVWDDNDKLAEALRIVIRRYMNKKYNKRPIVRIHLSRLDD